MKIYSSDMPNIQKKLAAPFSVDNVRFRYGQPVNFGKEIQVLVYLDQRDVAKRLDDVLGAENWQKRNSLYGYTAEVVTEKVETEVENTQTGKKYTKSTNVPVKNSNNEVQLRQLAIHMCEIGIKIWDDENHYEWVWKSDTAGDSAVEQEKGGPSDAFKRAGVAWGIAAYMYRITTLIQPKPKDKFDLDLAKQQYVNWMSDNMEMVSMEELQDEIDSLQEKNKSLTDKLLNWKKPLSAFKSDYINKLETGVINKEYFLDNSMLNIPEVIELLGIKLE